jgi:hypothetical protein
MYYDIEISLVRFLTPNKEKLEEETKCPDTHLPWTFS